MLNLNDIKEQLTPTEIKAILFEYEVYPYAENEEYIIFPTCCHNLEGGSPKLYYYTNTHLFVCYTHCNTSFDIFELIIKMEKLRGNDITLMDAVRKCGIEGDFEIPEDRKEDIKSLEYLKRMKEIVVPQAMPLKEIDSRALDQYVDNAKYLEPWINEGMSLEALRRFGIKYDMVNLAIVIPHKDKTGKIVGIRGRFMAEDAPNKYMPLTYQGMYMAHNLKDNLYGIYENMDVIKKKQTAFIYEGEKSVLLMDSYFGKDNNNSVATCGNKISNEQISLLKELGVHEVVLCYDKDYRTYNEMLSIQEKYMAIGQKLSNYFRTSIVMDYGLLLDYKDSPIDQGKEVFKELYKYRYYV